MIAGDSAKHSVFVFYHSISSYFKSIPGNTIFVQFFQLIHFKEVYVCVIKIL